MGKGIECCEMGGNEDRPTYDLADFAGGSKYWYVDPSANNNSPKESEMEKQRRERQAIMDALNRLGVVPQNEGSGF